MRILLVLLAIATSSCAHLTRYDVEACADLGPDGAHCAHTLTPTTRDIPKAQWDATRVGWFCEDSADFNNDQSELDQACVWISCTEAEQAALTSIKLKLKDLTRRAVAARKKYGNRFDQ